MKIFIDDCRQSFYCFNQSNDKEKDTPRSLKFGANYTHAHTLKFKFFQFIHVQIMRREFHFHAEFTMGRFFFFSFFLFEWIKGLPGKELCFAYFFVNKVAHRYIDQFYIKAQLHSVYGINSFKAVKTYSIRTKLDSFNSSWLTVSQWNSQFGCTEPSMLCVCVDI